jgi:hypothetical protein
VAIATPTLTQELVRRLTARVEFNRAEAQRAREADLHYLALAHDSRADAAEAVLADVRDLRLDEVERDLRGLDVPTVPPLEGIEQYQAEGR